MPRTSNQKLKLLYLSKILLEQTDDEHGLTREDIIQELSKYEIIAERKSFYSDIKELRQYGLDIIKEQKNRTTYYHVGMREFELAELKLLVDAVQCSKFITEKKSRQLIKKLARLTSVYEAQKLKRQIRVQGRVKTMNESILYNVDKIHQAITKNRRIQFQYYKWSAGKKLVPYHADKIYLVSPWELVWNNENYYLIGYDSDKQETRHFRVDKMLDIHLDDRKREGRKFFTKNKMADYANRHFGMFAGEEMTVRLLCNDDMMGVMIDYFGKKIPIEDCGQGKFITEIAVFVSDQFIGWLLGFGDRVKIIEPVSLVEKIKERGQQIMELYC